MVLQKITLPSRTIRKCDWTVPEEPRFVSDHDFTVCGKLDPEGGGGFQTPHKANRIESGFSSGTTFSANLARNPQFFRSLFSPLRDARLQAGTGSELLYGAYRL
jgi:hypothetical protein